MLVDMTQVSAMRLLLYTVLWQALGGCQWGSVTRRAAPWSLLTAGPAGLASLVAAAITPQGTGVPPVCRWDGGMREGTTYMSPRESSWSHLGRPWALGPWLRPCSSVRAPSSARRGYVLHWAWAEASLPVVVCLRQWADSVTSSALTACLGAAAASASAPCSTP